MLRDDFVAQLKLRLKNNNDATLDADIVAEMLYVQEHILEMADFVPWFLLTEEQETTTTVDDHRLALPDNPEFLMEWEEGCLWLYDETNTEEPYTCLEKEDFDDLRARFPGSGPTPKGYSFSGEYFWVVPRPSVVKTIRMFYYGRDDVLDTNIENKWLKYAADWFLGEVGEIIAAQYIEDEAAAVRFRKQADAAKFRLQVRDQAMKEANAQRIMGRLHYGNGA